MSEVFSDFIFLLVNISVNGILVLLLAILVGKLKQRFSSQFRKTALFTALISFVFMLVVSMILQFMRIPAPKPLFTLLDRQAVSQNIGFTPSTVGLTSDVSANSCNIVVNTTGNGPVNPGGADWLKWFVIIWVCGSLFYTVLLIKGLHNITKIKKGSFPISNPDCLTLLSELKDEISIKKGIELLFHDSVFSPLSFGFFKPVVILPGEALNWNDDCLRIVLLHELLHIKRKDYILNLLVRIVCALFWFNPLVWIAAKNYQFIQETACDDRILEMGVSPHTYASELVKLTYQYRHLKPQFNLSSSLYKKSNTERRVSEILETNKIKHVFRLHRILTLILIVFVLSMSFSFVSFMGASTVNIAGASEPEDIPDRWPVLDGAGSISSQYGDAISASAKGKTPNPGIDITNDKVMSIVASADGEVVKAGDGSILIRHKSGIDTFYGNLCIVSVANCQKVVKGELIGYCYSGRIHFELIKGNTSIDPLKLLKPAKNLA